MESIEKEFKEALERKIKEETEAKEKALLKVRLRLNIFEYILGISGCAIIWYNSNGYVLLGILLLMWGNNMSLMREIHKIKNNFYKNVWKDS